MNIDRIFQTIADEPAFRVKQIKQLIYKDCIESWNDAGFLPKPLKEKLSRECPLAINAVAHFSKEDRAVKALLTLDDGSEIETVLMRHGDGRNTVCVSTQVGCPMRCAFCATGQLGFKRNLTANEMLLQVLYFARLTKKENERISNVVYMGMGEPFLNYDNVLGSIKAMHDPEVFDMGARRFSISTCGIVEGINRFADEGMEINLAISLHAPNDELRKKLMPVAQNYSIAHLMNAIDAYIAKTNRKVMFEYLMIDGVNDTQKCAEELAILMRRKLCVVNLIPYNPTGGFRPSPDSAVQQFKRFLESRGVDVTVRHKFGQDIQAACGQLAGEAKRKYR